MMQSYFWHYFLFHKGESSLGFFKCYTHLRQKTIYLVKGKMQEQKLVLIDLKLNSHLMCRHVCFKMLSLKINLEIDK
jgi:hypothetical protein